MNNTNEFRWPDGARTVVAVTIHVDGPSVQIGRGENGLGRSSRGRYAIRRGVPRYLEMMSRLNIPATFFVCGYDVETFPDLYRQIATKGYELAAHGYHHENWDLGDTEPALLEQTHRIIVEITGQSPVGWCSPSGRKSAYTLPVLQRLGYIYDASEKDRDEPYFSDDKKNFVILPNNTVSLDDFPVYESGRALASELLDMWRSEYHAISQSEGYLQLTIHPMAGDGSGPPSRAAVVETFLTELKAEPDVHFLNMRDLARHCLNNPHHWAQAT
ncbi:polysaccharide deacetylase family protein [Paracoccus onubensis]|uniref:polysaccharide deacetylase family protein n=1 Tax=Paracoccus onubensis TaxID=1675788 RepID=UPI00273085AA|nr:polysaccharide deacetylase family protein [Paracoccus onubensis]MDP0929678.1 polysaccharide deacetylase family protein [Paracoccus onubensis]